VALALIDKKDAAAVGSLVAVLPDLPREQLWRAEYVLSLVAGDKAPAASVGEGEAARKQFCAAWAGWYRKHGKGLDLARIDTASRMLGLTLVVQLDIRGRQVGPGGRRVVLPGSVSEIGPDGKTRWEIKDLDYPVDAQVVGRDRVLITEYRGRQITERTFKGEIVWRKALNTYAVGARRLPNGHTLVNCRYQVLELDRSGREVATYNTRGGGTIAATRLKNGHLAVVDQQGVCTHIDGSGRAVKRVTLGQLTYTGVGTQLDILPNGNVVVPQYAQNKVIEYDAGGKKVWEADSQRPTSAMRLPNGHTLAASRYTRTIEEFDRRGKRVWHHQLTDGYVLSARRR
jgi:hypothetical protein